jgi:hypothetical protein
MVGQPFIVSDPVIAFNGFCGGAVVKGGFEERLFGRGLDKRFG